MRKTRLQRLVNALIIVSLIAITSNFGYEAQAASLTSLSDNMSRLKASTASDHEIKFVTPTGLASGQDLTVTFSADFTNISSLGIEDFDLAEGDSSNCSTANFTEKTLVASGATASQFNAAASGQIVTFTSGGASATITASRCVRIRIGLNAASGASGNTQISNGAVDDDDTVAIGGSFGDSGTLAVDIITDDQVVVSATVSPTITFAVSANSIGFGTLSASNDRFATTGGGSDTATTAHNLQVGTNAASGYTLYVLGATLTSGGNDINAIGGTATTSSLGSEQFGINLSASGGSGSVNSPYGTASNYAYNATSTTQDDIASSIGPSATTTYSVTYLANIAAETPAGSYSTTLTYTTTGSF